MKKYILMLLMASFIGIIANPEMLAASNSVTIKGIDSSKIVETIVPEVVPAEMSVATIETPETKITPTAPVVKAVVAQPVIAQQPVMPVVSITPNTVRNVNVSIFSDTIVVNPSYSDIYKTGKLIYAHNVSNLFSWLKNLSRGEKIVVNEKGIAKTYIVSDIVTYEKSTDGRLQLNGSGSYMSAIKNRALGHDLALMTCAGEMRGSDASHRLVAFIDEA